MSDILARVRWEMGQTLLPEHLRAQEESIIADTILRSRMGGLPFYGIAGLKWNETLLLEGVLSIQAMSLIMPSGLLLDVPGNADISPFNMNIAGAVNLPVYLHVPGNNTTGESFEKDWNRGDDIAVPRMRHRLVLGADQNHADAVETIKIAEFEKNPEGVWRLAKGFIPPLLQIGLSPFLKDELNELGEALELFQYNLSLDAASYLSGESLFSVKQCLKKVYRMQRFLANLGSEIHPHAYCLYEALKELYTEVSFYRNTAPRDITVPYSHTQLASCLGSVFQPLKEQMKMVRKQVPYIPFEFRDGVYEITLPPELREAVEVYFVIQKNQVTTNISFENLKPASPSRISLVHKFALQGVPVKKIDRPSFQHSFGPECDFYLIREGEEWDHALSESSLAFYNQSHFEEMDFYIYWRQG